MSELRQPIFVGLVVSSLLVGGMVIWVISGGLIERRADISGQHAALIDQRDELLRQLSDLSAEEICEFSALPEQPPADLLPSFDYDGTLDRSVAWIGAPASGASGTGFFVSNTHVVTNLHVVEGSGPQDEIYIAVRGHEPAVGHVTYQGNSNIGAPDLAVISLNQPIEWAQPLNIYGASSTDLRTRDVVAAGFPGVVLEFYGSTQGTGSGDVLNLPQLVLTAGNIASDDNNANDVQIILHTAQISSGNSGGPLVDECGAVVGINTFIVPDDGNVRMFAIGHNTLRDFLSTGGIPFSESEGECNP
jgi:S1-C subfamily serine protease